MIDKSKWTGEVMIGFLIDKLDRSGNKDIQKKLTKLMKKIFHQKK